MGDVITQIFLLNDPLRGGTNDSGKSVEEAGPGDKREADEKHSRVSAAWRISFDTRDLCIIIGWDGDRAHRALYLTSLLHILRDVMAHIIHII